MTTRSVQRSDLELEALRSWLGNKMSQAVDLHLLYLTEPTQGLSNRTLLLRATWQEDGERRERDMIARIQCDGNPPFTGDELTGVGFRVCLLDAEGRPALLSADNARFAEAGEYVVTASAEEDLPCTFAPDGDPVLFS